MCTLCCVSVLNSKHCWCSVFSFSLDAMFIKAITLDGFKSYAQRTEISGFDPLFNAVTGLNGSGKSNILDGICFVLGITNLSQVSTVCHRFRQSREYALFVSRFIVSCSSLRRSGMAHVNKGSHSFICHRHIYPQVEWAIPPLLAAAELHCYLVSTHFPPHQG